jgi:uncharacterized protein (TIGR00255 family)
LQLQSSNQLFLRIFKEYMPIYSMTGYASAQSSLQSVVESPSSPTIRLGLEIRSVNSRFLDLTFKLPDELREFEPLMREHLSAQLRRGKVEVKASIASSDSQGVSEPSSKLLQKLSSIEDNVRVWLPKAAPLSVSEVLRLSTPTTPGGAELGAPLTELLKETLKNLLTARAKEGARLAGSMLERIDQLKALTTKVTPIVPQLVEQQRLKFLERWREALGLGQKEMPTSGAGAGAGSAADAASSLSEAAHDRALTEAANFAIRIDVAEELTRLSSHLSEIAHLLSPTKNTESLGKRLDFLIQELHREANTLGSKSTSLELTRIGVDMKVLIEQLREQVQNIE